jgi:hypothetical protein
LREGKVFIADWLGGSNAQQGNTCWRKSEMFWLCGKCSQQLTLVRDGDKVVPATRCKCPGPSALREIRIHG